MKTLTVRQPEAWLLVHGIKDVENRTWSTTHRGPLLIHSSARKPTAADLEWLTDVCAEEGIPVPALSELTTGAVVGAVWLETITETDESPWWDEVSLAWICTHSAPCEPIPCKGKLGLWDHPTPADVEFTRKD